MELKDQVVSLEFAKKLKELGVKQESLFYWASYENPPHGIFKEADVPDDHWQIGSPLQKYFGNHDYQISAFTVAELGEMLPARVGGGILVLGHLNRGWVVQYRLNDKVDHEEYDSTEADARSKMLIYLIENKLVTP